MTASTRPLLIVNASAQPLYAALSMRTAPSAGGLYTPDSPARAHNAANPILTRWSMLRAYLPVAARKAKTAGAHFALPLLHSYDPPENSGKILGPARVPLRVPADSRPGVVSTLAGFGPPKPRALPHPAASDQQQSIVYSLHLDHRSCEPL